MRREDCIVDCVGPDCEGCRNYKTRQMKDEIKDKILEILIDKIKATPHDYYPTGIEGLPQSAREIADMVQKFVEWLIIDQEIFMGELTEQYIINDNLYVNGRKLKTLDELFNYWFDNIKDKEK